MSRVSLWYFLMILLQYYLELEISFMNSIYFVTKNVVLTRKLNFPNVITHSKDFTVKYIL